MAANTDPVPGRAGPHTGRIDRRHLIHLGVALPVGMVLGGCTDRAPSARQPLPPVPTTALPTTPTCADADDETPAQTEGPYFSSGSPQRDDLREAGLGGTGLVITGRVLDPACQQVDRAKLDFWQADDAGRYDNAGFRLRAHQFTTGDGRFRLSTIVPGRYSGRTRHIHVKAQVPNGPVLTTQLYFPGEPGNTDDRLFNPALLLGDYRQEGGARAASFVFVLRRA